MGEVMAEILSVEVEEQIVVDDDENNMLDIEVEHNYSYEYFEAAEKLKL